MMKQSRTRLARSLLALGVLSGCGAQAGNIDTNSKHAWSENARWIDFMPTGGGVTVHIAGPNSYLSGLAWSDKFGWIKFGSDGGGPYANDSTNNWGVNMNVAGELSGCAWGENIGWIEFDSEHSDVSVDTTTGAFEGMAWAKNVGYIRFEGTVPAYAVRTTVFDGEPFPDLDDDGMDDNWEFLFFQTADRTGTNSWDSDGMTDWEEFVAQTDPTNEQDVFTVAYVRPSVTSPAPFVVAWDSVSGRLYSVLSTTNLLAASWETNVHQRAGDGTVQTYTNTVPTALRFLKLTVELDSE